MKETENMTPPSLARRLTAILYDSLLVLALVAVVNALALGILVKATGGDQQLLGAHLVQLLTLLSIMGFFTLFWIKDGQTLGMQAWRIKLVDFQGKTPTTGRAILRCLAAIVSAGCLGLGYLWCLFDRHGRYWHDYVSGTELVLVPREVQKEPDD